MGGKHFVTLRWGFLPCWGERPPLTVDDEVAEDGVAVRDQRDQEERGQVQREGGQEHGFAAHGVAYGPQERGGEELHAALHAGARAGLRLCLCMCGPGRAVGGHGVADFLDSGWGSDVIPPHTPHQPQARRLWPHVPHFSWI